MPGELAAKMQEHGSTAEHGSEHDTACAAEEDGVAAAELRVVACIPEGGEPNICVTALIVGNSRQHIDAPILYNYSWHQISP